MTDYQPPRYLQTYRECEMETICNQARRGESISFVGVAGSGKSNLIKFLRDDVNAKSQYLGADTSKIHFPDVDATGWDGRPESLWSMMASALDRVTVDLPQPAVQYRTDPLHRLRDHLEWVCQQTEHKVMFMLDEFDDVLRQGPRSAFDQLSRLRSSGSREQLSYLVFTRKLPHVLGRQHELETRSKFYDLFRYRVYALPLHNERDSYQMLLHLNGVADNPLRKSELREIQALTGGHARLIKITFETWMREQPPTDDLDTYFARQPEIQDECNRILNGLHRQEREVAIRSARGQSWPDDGPSIDHLRRRGLLDDDDNWFAPFVKIYLRDYFG